MLFQARIAATRNNTFLVCGFFCLTQRYLTLERAGVGYALLVLAVIYKRLGRIAVFFLNGTWFYSTFSTPSFTELGR